MSATQPTYEESLTKIASLEKKLDTFLADKKAQDENKDEDKEMDANFKKAQDEMKDDDTEHKAMEDEKEKVKDAFKKAEDETDPEKKKEAMKKALEVEKDYKSKKGRKGEEHPIDEKKAEDDKKDMEAKIANTIMKKVPIMNKILEATRVMDPTNYDKIEKELTAATLKDVEAKYAAIQPYIAAIGLTAKTASIPGTMGMVPFQANLATEVTPDMNDIKTASIDSIDFSKVPTSKILEMYS